MKKNGKIQKNTTVFSLIALALGCSLYVIFHSIYFLIAGVIISALIYTQS